MRRLRRPVVTALTLALALAGLSVSSTASAVQPPNPGPAATLPSEVPSSTSPQVGNGHVSRIAQVGAVMVISGPFTSVSGKARHGVAAFSPSSGALTPFNPSANGQIDALIPGPTADTVYLGGEFDTVNGVKRTRLALVNLSTGAVDPAFQPEIGGGIVTDLVLRGGRLYLIGSFDKVGRVAHAGIASVNPTTGAVDPFVDIQLTGHHNDSGSGAQGRVGGNDADATADGRSMVVTGNFKRANGLLRDQVVKLDLSGSNAQIAPWATSGFSSLCQKAAYDGYIREVTVSPNGSFFVIAATGGVHGAPGLCDTITRWEMGSTSGSAQPTWSAASGGDTLSSVAVTSTAVYAGGHQRWINNPLGLDSNRAGSVGRAGLMALDPGTGLPFSWNPGRNPRGEDTYSILPTSTGVWFGYDTDFIGNRKYRRQKLAFFPYAGGTSVPAVTVAALPGTVFLPGNGQGAGGLRKAGFDGSTSPGATAAPTSGPTPNYTTWRGAFAVSGKVYYFDTTDAALHSRTFNGSVWGAPTKVDPYHDPLWDSVRTGTGLTTYVGTNPSLYGATSRNVTGMTYSAGRLLYTLSGDQRLYSRGFTPESGVMTETTVVVPSSISFATAKGMFVSHGALYLATTAGTMLRVGFNGSAVTGAPTTVGAGVSWTSRGMFLLN